MAAGGAVAVEEPWPREEEPPSGNCGRVRSRRRRGASAAGAAASRGSPRAAPHARFAFRLLRWFSAPPPSIPLTGEVFVSPAFRFAILVRRDGRIHRGFGELDERRKRLMKKKGEIWVALEISDLKMDFAL